MSLMIDEFLQEFYSDDALSLNTVSSWRLRTNKAGQPSLRIDFHNSFVFDSDECSIRPDRLLEIIQKLTIINSYKRTETDRLADNNV
jgi:hypothetical protein